MASDEYAPPAIPPPAALSCRRDSESELNSPLSGGPHRSYGEDELGVSEHSWPEEELEPYLDTLDLNPLQGEYETKTK